MNAVEHIVECYFRYCKGCFTMTDVKIIGGNNRQCDLLAFSLTTQEQFHIESSVTHDLSFLRAENDFREIFDKKFRGTPPKRAGKGTDHTKGKVYFDRILSTYQRVGLDPTKVQRIFVTWAVKNESSLQDFLLDYFREHRIKIQVISFRDEIMPELMEKVSTSNYDDEILRTLSLIRQHNMQKKRVT